MHLTHSTLVIVRLRGTLPVVNRKTKKPENYRLYVNFRRVQFKHGSMARRRDVKWHTFRIVNGSRFHDSVFGYVHASPIELRHSSTAMCRVEGREGSPLGPENLENAAVALETIHSRAPTSRTTFRALRRLAARQHQNAASISDHPLGNALASGRTEPSLGDRDSCRRLACRFVPDVSHRSGRRMHAWL